MVAAVLLLSSVWPSWFLLLVVVPVFTVIVSVVCIEKQQAVLKDMSGSFVGEASV